MEKTGDIRAKRYWSDALQSLHEVAEDLHDVGAIDKATMRHFDLSCLTPAAGRRHREGRSAVAIKRFRCRPCSA